jgi:Fe-S oxidoreductase
LHNFSLTFATNTGMELRGIFQEEINRHEALVSGQVVPAAERCVQCGICSYSCPIGIDVRRHAWLGTAVVDSHCLTCGECIKRCPRSVLHFERAEIFRGGKP